MTTGVHVVRDLSCTRCLRPLGWRYVSHELLGALRVDLTPAALLAARLRIGIWRRPCEPLT